MTTIMQDYKITKKIRITMQPSLYFLDDFPCPLPFDFLKGGISGDKISPCITLAGDDLDTL